MMAFGFRVCEQQGAHGDSAIFGLVERSLTHLRGAVEATDNFPFRC